MNKDLLNLAVIGHLVLLEILVRSASGLGDSW